MANHETYKRNRTMYTRVLLGLLLVCMLFYAFVLFAKRQPIEFGTESSLNLYPATVTTSGWGGVDATLIQDLDDDAIYQHFSAINAAYYRADMELRPSEIPKLKNEPRTVNGVPADVIYESTIDDSMSDERSSSSDDGVSSEDDAATSETIVDEDTTVVESEAEVSSEPVELQEEVVPESTSEPEPEFTPESNVPAEEVSVLPEAAGYLSNLFTLVRGVFPFAQQSTSTSIDEEGNVTAESVAVEVSEPEPVALPESTSSAPAISEESAGVIAGTSTVTDSGSDHDHEQTTMVITTETVGSVAATTTPENEIEVVVEPSDVPIDLALDIPESVKVESDNEIVLGGFAAPDLASGEFITGMQLRVSLAGQLKKTASSSAPYVEILFGPEDSLESVGVILLEDEVSNALNGGFFLFALPQLTSLETLAETQVVVRYQGAQDELDGLYLDAAWIEVDTKRVTREDLMNRGVSEKLVGLKRPELAELLSTKTNFKRTEVPVFNLRYESQRNFLVRGMRSVLGRKLVEVSDIAVTHRSLGQIGVAPKINTTSDGLVTVQFDTTDLRRLRPGEYTVDVTYDEGGATYTDSFSFQWGILTINPNKTEYAVGEQAELSIGALTPNGNTVCHTNLDLYVIDPNEFITKVPVTESGLCNGNNVIDVPDFSAVYDTTTPGTYELYLERLDNDGEVMSFTTDTFLVVANQTLSIERNGPTRIFPPAPYPMTLTVESVQSFSGTLTERVPANFKISSTSADITEDGDWQVLTWDITLLGGGSRSVSYTFDAPNLSPFLYELGPAELIDEDADADRVPVATVSGSSTATTTESSATSTASEMSGYFLEHRQWQIASDAAGNMMLYWADGASIPTADGWSCISCGSGTHYQRFAMGSSTYNVNGGTVNHTHTATGNVSITSNTGTAGNSGNSAPTGHTHGYTPTISTVSNLPEYRQLRVIAYTDATGEPPTIPVGAIGIFDVASSSLPSGWTRYAAQDDRYVYGENTIGSPSGSNVHTHSISGSTANAVSVGGTRTQGSTPNGSSLTHSHVVNSASTDSINKEPPYITVLLGQAQGSAAAAPNGLIAMWTIEVDNGWIDVSSDPGDPFSNRFIKPSTTYGVTGGSVSHSHADVTGMTTQGPSATANTFTGSTGAISTHTHNVSVTNFSTISHLPPYVTAIFGKKQGTNPVYTQTSSRWYVNENAEPPTDPWPDDGIQSLDLSEREYITATSTPVKDGDQIRLRMNVGVGNATSSAGATFKLQYAATASVCSAATGWATVGDISSSTVWRGYNNTLADHDEISTQVLASSTVNGTYEENGYATSTPNDISVGEYGEWDFVLEHNGADPGTNYCFRMVEGDGTAFFSYTDYPRLYTDEAPAAPTLIKLFDNEKTPSITPFFQFISDDTEGQLLHYQIEIDTDTAFVSPIEYNTTDDEDQFIRPGSTEKPAFTPGEIIEFTPLSALNPAITYYWRVRAQDENGSGSWGDWSEVWSFTTDTTLAATAWFQTEDEQFSTDTLVGVATGTDRVSLSGASGSITSTAVDFDDGILGTAWGSFVANESDSSNQLSYQIEYLDETMTWTLVPDADLPGNSGGFASTTSLLTLDTDVYNQLRVVGTFASNTGTPLLFDWTVNWGYRVETPTITKLFPNEQVGTTTPLFAFSTTDPQSDDLTYQIQWSTTPDFAASTTRTSDGDAGFLDTVTGSSTGPFTSGTSIQYTIQSADALIGTTTYWWRVRAKDPGGADAYSFWTDPRSFTVIPGTQVSTWYQTTADQFDTNILSGTVSLSAGAVSVATTATEAMLVYGQGSETAPRYQQWNGTSWGAEGQLQSISSGVRWAVVRAGTTREEYVAATIGANAYVYAQVFALGEWDNLQNLSVNVGDATSRGLDVAYESTSGDAMVVYCDATSGEAGWRKWNGSSWSSPGEIILNSANSCEWVQLASDPTSNEIIALVRDSTGSQYQAQVWSGTGWSATTTMGSVTEANHEGMAVEYEESSGQAVIVTSDGNPNRLAYDVWTGSSWAGAGVLGLGGEIEWGKLVRDIGTDNMALCLVDDTEDIAVARWTGSTNSWTLDDNRETASSKTEPGFACVYEDGGHSGHILLTYSDASATNYQHYNAGWGGETALNSLVTMPSMQLIRTGNANVLGLFYDSSNDTLRSSEWSGSSWSSTADRETDMPVSSAPFGQPFFMAPRNASLDGTAIVAPGVDFDDGLGPYWDKLTWSDSQGAGESILYHVQYQTATGSWAFVPDSQIPYNVAGTTTGPIDLTGLDTTTYNVLRPYAEFTCADADNCPVVDNWRIEWAGGITVSGTLNQADEVTPVSGATIAVAVNGVLQSGKTGTSDVNGDWSIGNVTTYAGDIVTVFVSGAADSNEAVGVARYSGTGDMTGITLYQQHVTLGSADATTTPLTNAEVGIYDIDDDPSDDVFIDLSGTTLNVCGKVGCTGAELYIGAGTSFTPGGRVVTHDIQIDGTFVAGSYTHEVSGSWDNNGTTTMTGSTVVMAATSTTESIDSTGAVTATFNNLTFGTTTGSAVWALPSLLDVDGALTVTRGTLARGATPITVAGTLTTGASGFWTGIGTTTFDGASGANWRDLNVTLQNVGNVLIDGASKVVTLTGNVAANRVYIGTNDTLSASASHYDITVYDNWRALATNNFLAQNGTVFFAATTSNKRITMANNAFYDVTFTGANGDWAFSEDTVTVNGDFIVSTGTVAMPVGTTTIRGSFDATGGSFQHNNGTLAFTGTGAETITFDGGNFTNVARNIVVNGSGSWTVTDAAATTTSDIRVKLGTLNFSSGIFAIGGTLIDSGGNFTGGGGTLRFYSSAAEVLTAGGSTYASTTFDGTGSWSFSDASVTANGSVRVQNGAVTLPSTLFTIGGSYINNDTVTAGTGAVLFNSADAGETVNFGAYPLYDVTFNGTGGWTLVDSATTTNDFTLTAAGDWTLGSGLTLSVGGMFTNSVGSTTTNWSGSTLSLEAGAYSINIKTDEGDQYATLRIKADTDIAMWNSSASTYVVNNTGSLYSQDHAEQNGDLYIYGEYVRSSGTEYWTNNTDFDGSDLTGNERQVDVRFANGASATIANATLSILGSSTASTTIASQSGSTYEVAVNAGTTSARYYEFSDLGGAGLSLVNGTIVESLRDGSYIVAENAAAALSVSSDTIDTNPSKQIFNVRFATTTAITATNVEQTDLPTAPSSFWWFRNGTGNLYGEQFDNDTGNPGSIRFDDSALVISVSGTVYDSDLNPLGGTTCDDSTDVVDVYVDGVFSTSTSCASADGSFTASGVVVIGDPTLTVFLNDTPGGEVGSVITRTPTVDITNLDIYENRVIVRNEDTEALTIANLAVMDESDDDDLRFTAATSTSPDELTVRAGNELFVFASSTFAPGGVVTLNANATANGYDGTLYLDGDATYTATGTLTVGGRFVLESGATFVPASSTVVMTASTTGKSITSPSEITLNTLTFTGSGDWNLGADLLVLGDMTVSAGTVTGTNDITLPNGSVSGDGVLSLGGGTVTIESSNTLGGTNAWTFNNLTLGDGADAGTTTPQFTSTTTIGGVLTIDTAHFLDAGATAWDLAGTGSVFVENGTLQEDTSTFRYSGNGATVTATRYYNLDINAGAGTPTYIAGAIGVPVTNRLTVGGEAPSTFTLATNNPAFDVDGDVLIRSNGTLLASASGSFTVGGDYDNNGTFTANGGTVTFDGSGTHDIAAGNSSFATAVVNGVGDFTVSEHATATSAFTLTAAGSFTLGSGEVLAVGGTFTNSLADADTTWTGSTLRLYGGGDYAINAKTLDDSYATLAVAAGTQIRMWNSDASIYAIDTTGSLYSMDHADVSGDLYIFGAYRKTSANDFWSYNKDFDGVTIAGRVVDVYMATSSSLLITGGSLAVIGDSSSGTTTIQSSATDLYDFRIGGTASVTMQYYAFRDMAANGITFSGSPDITTLSNGDFELAVTGDSTMTVGGSVLTANPAKTFNYNRFALGAAANGFNITATGTALSAWRFFGHYGGIDGEDYDVDSGDPGELLWDNSTSTLDISGRVLQDDSSSVSGACTGASNIHLYINGALEDTTSCSNLDGSYTFSDVNYSAGESVVVYINNAAQNAVTVSTDLVSTVFNYDLYENHLILRHESTNPIEITDLDDWDVDQDGDGDLFFDAEGGANTLVLDSNIKLIVWDNKEFEPGGNITTGGGTGDALDGTIELQDDAMLTLNTGESHSIGGNLQMGTGSVFTPAQSTVTFTSSGSGRIIDTNESGFYNVILNSTGSYNIVDAVLTIGNDLTLTVGALTLPTATTSITGSLTTTGGSFDANGGVVVFTSSAAETITANGSDFNQLRFTGSGSWLMNDTNATATKAVTIYDGTVTLPSGTFTIGGGFRNLGGSVTHNTSELVMTATTTASLLASSSDLYAVTFAGSGAFAMEDENLTLLNTLVINAGSLQLASGTLSIGGSFDASGGTFSYLNPNATNTILFNSGAGGNTIDPGSSDFDTVQIGAPSGGYTLAANATTTNNFILASANSFTAQSGTILYVGNVFSNAVGGANTTWTGSTLVLNGANAYTLNSKSAGGDIYGILSIGANSDLRMWNSSATTISVDGSSSLYSQDHGASDGSLNIYGDFHISTTTEYWSFATDFDGTAAARAVTVSHAANATTTVDGGTLHMVGTGGNETTVTNQGSGVYNLDVTSGTLNAQYYAFRNLAADGLDLSGTPTIVSLNNGDYELAVDTGTLLTVAATTINANSSMVITGNRFATTTAISGNNITVTGTTPSVWTYTSHTGNLDGEAYDVDGATACGSIRFDDSDCQITQQTHYRWRGDTGTTGVPDTEWFDSDWDARKRVRVENADAQPYTDAVVELTVTYDSDMQADFDDLRFTDSSGTTTIPYWIGSSTDSTVAEVWVKVPTLPASDYATIFMYYNNPTALSSSSVSDTFEAGDDFEDGDISEYSGETIDFAVNGNFAYDGSYGLDAINNTGKTESGGIYDLAQQTQQGQTIRYLQYIDTAGTNDEVCTKFGIQTTGAPASNYAVCLEVSGTDRIEIVRDAVSDDASGIELATSSVPGGWVTGWYEVEIDWEEDDDIIASLYRDDVLVTSASVNDSTYDQGGIGFTFWFQRGGWDSYTVRKTLTTEPTIRFGVEQSDGGASWLANLDTAYAGATIGAVTRLRLMVENSGTAITNQQFTLEFAEQGASPSCEAVSLESYSPVPVQASCGTSPICMVSSGNITNGESTVDLLDAGEGNFTPGEVREDPSNTTGNLDVAQGEYTELEYAITPTINVDDENLCFRVSNNETDYDTYLRVAKLSIKFDPSVSTVYFNDMMDIALLPGTTTRVYATSTVSDLNGYNDLVHATSTFYTTTATAACTADNNDCYIGTKVGGQCSYTSCSGNSCELVCYADMYFHADPTASDGGAFWYAFIEAEDAAGGTGFNTSSNIDVDELPALTVNGSIDYGQVAPETDTGTDNASTTILNIGNIPIDIEIESTDLSDGFSSIIPGEDQKFSSTSFDYATCGSECVEASTTTAIPLNFDLAKPTVETPPVSKDVFWGISIPFGINSAPHSGFNTFYAIDDT